MHRVHDVRTAQSAVTPASSAEQAIHDTAFPAYFWQAGKSVRASFSCAVVDQNSTNTLTTRLRFGTSAVAGTAIAASSAVIAADGDVGAAEALLTCRSVTDGVAKIYAQALSADPDATGTISAKVYAVAEISVATDVVTHLGYTAHWSASNAANQAACETALVEEIS